MWKKKVRMTRLRFTLPLCLILLSSPCLAEGPRKSIPGSPDDPSSQGRQDAVPVSSILPVDETARSELTQLLKAAMARNPEIRSRQARIGQAQGRQLQAGLHPNPSIGLEVETELDAAGTADRGFTAGYSHVFETAGKRGRRLAVAEVEVQISEDELAETRRVIAGQLRTLFLQILLLKRDVSTRQDLLRIATDFADLIQAQVQEGEVPALTLDQAKAEAERIQADLGLLVSQEEGLLLQLRTLAGLDPTDTVVVRGELEPHDIGPPLEELSRRALAARPDLKAARAEVDRVSAQAELLKAQAVPNIVGSAGYSYSRSAFDLFGLTADGRPAPIRELSHGISVGVSLELPVRDRNQGNLAAAAAEGRAQRFHIRSLESSIRQEVAVAYQRYASSYHSLAVLQTEVLDRSRMALEALQKAYELGEIAFNDVLAEQRRLADLQGAYNSVLQAYATAAADLAQAVAVPIP